MLAATFAVSGCTATPTSPVNPAESSRPTVGSVSGKVFGFGGPSPGTTIAPTGPGTVTLTGTGGRFTTRFDAAGRFTLDLSPGTYRMKAESFDGLWCTGRVRVRAGEVAVASAVCPIP